MGGEEVDDASLAERLGASPILSRKKHNNKSEKKSGGGSAKRREVKGKPKFASTLAWAQDTSPIPVTKTPDTPAVMGSVVETGASPKLAKSSKPDSVIENAPAPTESSLKLVLEEDEEEDES